VDALALGVVGCAVACGGLISGSAGEVGSEGGTIVPDGGAPATDVAAPSQACHKWTATSPRVQVSNIPSLVELMSAVASPSGVLVGYADEQAPPVDSSWHLHLIKLPDGQPALDQTPLHRDDSPLAWTAISIARGSSGFAATASDQSQGMQFAPIDESGVVTGEVARLAGDPGRYLLATTTGFSVLRSAFNESGTRPPPVDLALLDAAGNLVSTKTLLDRSVKTDWYERYGLPDLSFLLVWPGPSCDGCSGVFARHYAEDGTPLAPVATLHDFGPMDYGSYAIAPTTRGFLFAWSKGGAGPYDLMGQPFDADGRSLGPSGQFAQVSGANAPTFTLASTPGGDLVAAWADGPFTTDGHVYVQAVAADGSAEGTATTLDDLVTSDSSIDVVAVASPLGAMVLYENFVSEGMEVFGVPIQCAQ